MVFMSKVFGQDPENKSIVGTWVSEEDNTWKLVFASDSTCKQYSENNLMETDNYVLSNTSPQCGINVAINGKSLFLSLKDISDGEELCYYVNGITDKVLSLTYFNRGGAMVFLRSQTDTLTMQSGYNNIASAVSNEGLAVNLKLLFYPSATMIVGTNYFVGNIGANLRPEASQAISININNQSWVITVNPDGNVFCEIAGGSPQSAYTNIDLGVIQYQLYDPTNQ